MYKNIILICPVLNDLNLSIKTISDRLEKLFTQIIF